jgi:hypothetical protein
MGIGLRQVVDLMAEIGLALLEPIYLQTLSAPIGPGPGLTLSLNPSTPQPATTFLYPGALVVVGWHGGNAEVVSVITVLGNNNFTANLLNAHFPNEQVFSATFPTQQPTDPIFTQSEILGYIAQAQNEFLTKVPLIFSLFPNLEILIGQSSQVLPPTTIELERVAVQSNPASTSFAISSISRTAGEVTAILSSPSLPDQWTPQLPIQVLGVTDPSFNSASNSTFLLDSVSSDGLTLTWPQSASDSTSSGGLVSRPILTRLYESSQEQIGLNQPWWSGQQGSPPTAWYEDRQGVYGWGLAPPPASNYWMELLASVRAGEVLGLLDYFLVPDVFVYAIKWRALAYCWSKDGVQRSPSMERFAKGKFDFYCLLADRFLRNLMEKTAAAGGNF